MKPLLLRWFTLLSLAAIVSLTGCRTMVYSAYEKVGIYKRDLLKKRVIAARGFSLRCWGR